MLETDRAPEEQSSRQMNSATGQSSYIRRLLDRGPAREKCKEVVRQKVLSLTSTKVPSNRREQLLARILASGRREVS